MSNSNTQVMEAITKYIDGLGLRVPPFAIKGYFGFAYLVLTYSDEIITKKFDVSPNGNVLITNVENLETLNHTQFGA